VGGFTRRESGGQDAISLDGKTIYRSQQGLAWGDADQVAIRILNDMKEILNRIIIFGNGWEFTRRPRIAEWLEANRTASIRTMQ
jgi:hypothetical protein